ncbi:DUF4238 domain-containing protein [Flavobacterium circumlabens]|uniref:DUF4238 domain-containing protein n=1 Tax=Flavobacterium circumlabens TaxID=2133765 RepID=A0A4Y7UG94_9FLAO|nr:DUF4238 domain-containing protein [Flavobacterium circumlabens]TCN60150.1 uncharacterized protein DUF4238 [Flavobacterium circumlabens]TEB45376.1 DUF4238 domain-containing protein [Flavobacterium circumlabens]
MAQQKKQIPKNQHFVPQFFQRFFSYENNGKTIGMFNTQGNLFKNQVSISSQLSSDYFYGLDGELEEWLSQLERDSAPIFREMWEKEKLPIAQSPDHSKMLHFMVVLDLRNPIHFRILSNFEQKLLNTKSKISEDNVSNDMIPGLKEHQTDQGKLNSLKSAELVVPDLLELKYKLIKNTTSNPFIISDNPIIMYNQFLERRNWKFGSQRDFGLKGLQMFLPLNDSYMLAVYDPNIYKLGNKKEHVVKIDNKNSIDQLNLLQFLNSETTVNFSHRASKHYIETLYEKSKKYKKANDASINVHKMNVPRGFDNFTAQMIEMGVSDLNIKLTVQKLNFISKSSTVKLKSLEDQYRKNVKFKGYTHIVYRFLPITENS